MKTLIAEFSQWAIEQHELTNHQYDLYLPYEFHLRLANQVGKDFKHLMPKMSKEIYSLFPEEHQVIIQYQGDKFVEECVFAAIFGHDLMEDARVSYNDILKKSNVYIAEIIFSLTNVRGRNRSEKQSDEYYAGIRAIPGATFCKLCDRIANVRYGILTKSSMVEKYRREYPSFKEKLYVPELDEMFVYLESLFDKQL